MRLWIKLLPCVSRLCTWFPQIHYNGVILSGMTSKITSITIVCSNVYSGMDQRKHKSSVSLAFVRGIHRSPVNSPHKGPVTRKMFPFNNVIMYLMSSFTQLHFGRPLSLADDLPALVNDTNAPLPVKQSRRIWVSAFPEYSRMIYVTTTKQNTIGSVHILGMYCSYWGYQSVVWIPSQVISGFDLFACLETRVVWQWATFQTRSFHVWLKVISIRRRSTF